MFDKLFHYSHALETRFFQLFEVSALRRDGVDFGSHFKWEIWKNPAQTEDWVNLARFLNPVENVLLLDIGANVGKFTSEFLSIYKNSRSVCFEPVSTTCEQLKERFADDGRVGTHRCAISNFDGRAEMHLEKESTLCSLVEYTDAANAAYQAGTAQLEQIDCRRLDSFPYRKGAERLFVKIDVQGFEIEVIRGAMQTLAGADAVLLECSFADEYKGKEPSFSLACSLLRECDLYPIVFQDFGRSISNYAFERDVLFVKRALLARIWNRQQA
jgi:FkbM family methyltransferase